MSEEELELGRLMGGLKAAYPDVYQRIKTISAKKKKKVSVILSEALDTYEMVESLKSVSPESLVASMKLLERMIFMTTMMMKSLSEVFTSEFTKAVLGARIDEVRAMIEEAEKARQSSVEEKLKETQLKLVSSLIEMVSGTMLSMTSSLARTAAAQAQPQQGKIVQAQKEVKIVE